MLNSVVSQNPYSGCPLHSVDDSLDDSPIPQLTGLRIELEDSETNDTWGQSWIFHGARFRSLCIQLFGTRDGLATRYAGQSGGCARAYVLFGWRSANFFGHCKCAATSYRAT